MLAAVAIFVADAARCAPSAPTQVGAKSERQRDGARRKRYGFPLLLSAIGVIDSATRMGFLTPCRSY